MSIWTRLGKAGWVVAKGSWSLRRASRRAEVAATADEEPWAGPEVDVRPTPQQAVLLVRYVAGTFVLAWLGTIFLLKYPVLAGGVALVVSDAVPEVGIALIVLFVMLAALQWLVARVVRRLGAVDRLAELDRIVATGSMIWWPNLKREFARVGLTPRPWRVLRVGAGFATRRLSGREQAALNQVDWRAVLPSDELRRARQVLARAAGAPLRQP